MAAAKFTVPIRGELVIGVPSRLAHDELSAAAHGSGDRGEQVAAWRITKLIALKQQQLVHDGINTGYTERRFQHAVQRRVVAHRRQHRDRRTDERPRGKTAALARALVVHEEESQLGVLAQRASQAAAKNVLLDGRPWPTRPVQKVFIRVENIVAEKLVYIAMKGLRARLQNCVHVAAAIAALAGIVQ